MHRRAKAPPVSARKSRHPDKPARPVREAPTRIAAANAAKVVASHFIVSRRLVLALAKGSEDIDVSGLHGELTLILVKINLTIQFRLISHFTHRVRNPFHRERFFIFPDKLKDDRVAIFVRSLRLVVDRLPQ
jgi:hypothetical protein